MKLLRFDINMILLLKYPYFGFLTQNYLHWDLYKDASIHLIQTINDDFSRNNYNNKDIHFLKANKVN
jgi:hypothetical protein